MLTRTDYPLAVLEKRQVKACLERMRDDGSVVPLSEVAESMGVSKTAVHKLLKRAVRCLDRNGFPTAEFRRRLGFPTALKPAA